MEILATIEEIYKHQDDFYVKLCYKVNVGSSLKITFDEAKLLKVGQTIKIKYWWLEGYSGSDCSLVRPIQVLVDRPTKFKVLSEN